VVRFISQFRRSLRPCKRKRGAWSGGREAGSGERLIQRRARPRSTPAKKEKTPIPKAARRLTPGTRGAASASTRGATGAKAIFAGGKPAVSTVVSAMALLIGASGKTTLAGAGRGDVAETLARVAFGCRASDCGAWCRGHCRFRISSFGFRILGRSIGQGGGEDFIEVAPLEARLIDLNGAARVTGLAEIRRGHHYRLVTAGTLDGEARLSPGDAHELVAMGAAEAYWHGKSETRWNRSEAAGLGPEVGEDPPLTQLTSLACADGQRKRNWPGKTNPGLGGRVDP
jgi:hypothetical protein